MKLIHSLLLLSPVLLVGCDSRPPIQPGFDIDALIGKKSNELDNVLGPPTIHEGPGLIEEAQRPSDGKKYWRKPQASLIVTYDLNNNRVKHFFFSPGEQSNEAVFSSQDEMLKLGNLKREAPNYRIEFVENKAKAGSYYAVKAIPKG